MDVFVYGPLLLPELMHAVCGAGLAEPQPALLAGFAMVPVADDTQPMIVADPDGHVEGLVWRALSATAIDRLDAYQSAFGAYRATTHVQIAGQMQSVQHYLPPAGLSVGTGAWSLAVWQTENRVPAILAAQELLSLDPRPEPAQLQLMWPMIAARAWSRHRAAHAAPATIRHAAQPSDMAMVPNQPPHGWFFRFQGFDVTHLRFDGTRSDLLKREAFIGFDAVVVLPYDPLRDKVMLLEQPRVGALVRHDPNPWMLEAVAGIVDAGETPHMAAMRETAEEAGLIPRVLVPAGNYYPSPGASTDYFYSFVAVCDLPADRPYLGGLDVEGEDLRLHPVTFDAALALADSGEIATGPLLTLLYWLARHRDRLRATG